MTGQPWFEVDDLIVGSSPVSLLEAVHLADTGKRVALLERQPSLGGAWRVHDCLGFDDVEISPHLFMPDPVAYQIIEQVFDIELEVMDPVPVYRYWSDDLFRQEYPIADRLGEQLRDDVQAARESRRHRYLLPVEVAVAAKKLSRRRSEPVRYPKGGLTTLLERAVQVLEDRGVTVLTGVEVREIAWSSADARFTVTTSAGELGAGCIAVPRVFDVDRFSVDGRPVPIYYADNHSTHLAIRTTTSTPGQLRFLKVTGSPYFELINDITPYCRGPVEQADRVVAARCTRSLTFDGDDVGCYVDHLRELDYLPPTDRLVDHVVTEAEDRVLAHYMKPRLQRLLGDAIRFLGAAELDITDAILRFNRERWHFVRPEGPT